MSRGSGAGEAIATIVVLYIIYRLLPLLIFVAILGAIAQMIDATLKAIGQLVASLVQFFVQLITGVVQFVLAIPQPVWYCLFFVLGIVACAWWISKGWSAVQRNTKGLADGVQKNPLVYLGIPAGCIVLLTCCAITVFAGSQLVNFIQQHVVIR